MKNCLYLINVSEINIPGVFNYSDLWLALYIIYNGFWAIKLKNFHAGKPKFTFIILGMTLLCVLSAYQSYKLTGQPISLGLRPQRFYIVILLSYFVIRKLFYIKKIEVKSVLNSFVYLGIFEAVISIIQQLVYSKFVFLYCETNFRYGSVRLYLSDSVIVFAMMIAMDKILRKCKDKSSFVMIVLGLVYTLNVTKGRMGFIAIIIALLSGYALMKGNSRSKVKYFLIIIIFCIVLIQSPMFQDLIGSNNVDTLGSGDTLTIREQGRKHYFNVLKEEPLLGGGYPNSLYEPSTIAAGFEKGYFLVDNGIFGFMYIYGILGLLVWFWWFAKIGIISLKLYLHSNTYFSIMYFIALGIMSLTVIHWFWNEDALLILVLFICIIENQHNRSRVSRIEF
jgi:O-antigen ligase